MDKIHLQIERNILVSALSAASRLVSGRELLPILTNYFVQFNSLGNAGVTATNLNISVIAPMFNVRILSPGEGRFLMPASVLPAVKKMRSGEILDITFCNSTNKLNIESSDVKLSWATLSHADYPSINITEKEPASTFTLPQAGALLDVLDFVGECIAKPQHKLGLPGVYVSCKDGEIDFMSTDTHRLAYSYLKAQCPDTNPVILSPTVISLLKSNLKPDQPVDIEIHEKQVRFFQSDTIALACRPLDADYPEYRDLIPQDGIMLPLPRQEFLDVLPQLLPTSSEITHAVDMRWFSDRIELKAVGDLSEGKASIPVRFDCKSNGKPAYQITMNAQYVLDGIKHFDDPMLMMLAQKDNGEAVLIRKREQADKHYVCMPIS